MGNKQEELEVCVRSQGHDLIAITETWWDSSHDWNAVMDGYVLFRKDRPARQGGGVALYVREQLESIDLCLGVDEEQVESLWVRIKGQANMGDTVVGVYYVPLDQEEEVNEAFYRQLEVALRSQVLVLMGDFNHPDICWKGNTARHTQSRRFLQSIDDNILTQQRKTRENVDPLPNEVGALVTEDTEKAELLNAFFALIFTAKTSPQESQTLEVGEKVWRKEDLPLVEEDWVREHLGKLDIHKSMGPDAMHPQVLRELAGITAKPLSIIFERSWRTGEVSEDWRKANATPAFKKSRKEDPGNYRPVSLTSIPGKVMEQLILGVTNKHVEEKKVTGSGQHGFTKGKSCLTNLIAFYDGMTGWVDEGRAVDVVYLDFSKAFDTISRNILIGKLRKCGLDEWTVR
ncbi:mitochondrial enolase superfamily member 1 [Grus japonensis]|uniref:Mitochondrial enolase superfamily member 1 n=1 Tax=Grus japonensis TaxID=30415 RepID=A0ABC9WQC4_GRUJA